MLPTDLDDGSPQILTPLEEYITSAASPYLHYAKTCTTTPQKPRNSKKIDLIEPFKTAATPETKIVHFEEAVSRESIELKLKDRLFESKGSDIRRNSDMHAFEKFRW